MFLFHRTRTPHPPSLRSGALSLKGRGWHRANREVIAVVNAHLTRFLALYLKRESRSQRLRQYMRRNGIEMARSMDGTVSGIGTTGRVDWVDYAKGFCIVFV